MCVAEKVKDAIELEALTAVTGGPAIPGVAAVTVEGAPGLAAVASVFTVTLRASAWDKSVHTTLRLTFCLNVNFTNAMFSWL